MATKNNYGFFGDSFNTTVRGHQKIKKYARRQLIHLPAHERMTPQDKMFKKMWLRNRWRKQQENEQ